jgi:hypothetical protein
MVEDLAPQSGGEGFKFWILQPSWWNQPRLGLLGLTSHVRPPRKLGF